MGKRIVIVGAGAVGGYVGAHLTAGGHDVTMIDPWPAHVEAMKTNGMEIYGMTPQERMSVPMKAMHLTEVQNLAKQAPVDIAFISVKSYDTVWATQMIAQYLSSSGCVVSMQNCINEERVAGVVGWGRVLGCIVTGGVGVDLYEPGHIRRGYAKRADITSFYIGEPSGIITKRAEEIADIMSCVDASKATDNLWGERWTKLCVNGMRNGVSAATGMGGNARDQHEAVRRICIQLGGESVRVGQKLGYKLGKVGALPYEMLAKASEGDRGAYDEISRLMVEGGAGQAERSDYQRPSMAQDMEKGRKTEIEFMNGLIVRKGKEVGIATPANEKLVQAVLSVESGKIKPSAAVLGG